MDKSLKKLLLIPVTAIAINQMQEANASNAWGELLQYDDTAALGPSAFNAVINKTGEGMHNYRLVEKIWQIKDFADASCYAGQGRLLSQVEYQKLIKDKAKSKSSKYLNIFYAKQGVPVVAREVRRLLVKLATCGYDGKFTFGEMVRMNIQGVREYIKRLYDAISLMLDEEKYGAFIKSVSSVEISPEKLSDLMFLELKSLDRMLGTKDEVSALEGKGKSNEEKLSGYKEFAENMQVELRKILSARSDKELAEISAKEGDFVSLSQMMGGSRLMGDSVEMFLPSDANESEEAYFEGVKNKALAQYLTTTIKEVVERDPYCYELMNGLGIGNVLEAVDAILQNKDKNESVYTERRMSVGGWLNHVHKLVREGIKKLGCVTFAEALNVRNAKELFLALLEKYSLNIDTLETDELKVSSILNGFVPPKLAEKDDALLLKEILKKLQNKKTLTESKKQNENNSSSNKKDTEGIKKLKTDLTAITSDWNQNDIEDTSKIIANIKVDNVASLKKQVSWLFGISKKKLEEMIEQINTPVKREKLIREGIKNEYEFRKHSRWKSYVSGLKDVTKSLKEVNPADTDDENEEAEDENRIENVYLKNDSNYNYTSDRAKKRLAESAKEPMIEEQLDAIEIHETNLPNRVLNNETTNTITINNEDIVERNIVERNNKFEPTADSNLYIQGERKDPSKQDIQNVESLSILQNNEGGEELKRNNELAMANENNLMFEGNNRQQEEHKPETINKIIKNYQPTYQKKIGINSSSNVSYTRRNKKNTNINSSNINSGLESIDQNSNVSNDNNEMEMHLFSNNNDTSNDTSSFKRKKGIRNSIIQSIPIQKREVKVVVNTSNNDHLSQKGANDKGNTIESQKIFDINQKNIVKNEENISDNNKEVTQAINELDEAIKQIESAKGKFQVPNYDDLVRLSNNAKSLLAEGDECNLGSLDNIMKDLAKQSEIYNNACMAFQGNITPLLNQAIEKYAEVEQKYVEQCNDKMGELNSRIDDLKTWHSNTDERLTNICSFFQDQNIDGGCLNDLYGALSNLRDELSKRPVPVSISNVDVKNVEQQQEEQQNSFYGGDQNNKKIQEGYEVDQEQNNHELLDASKIDSPENQNFNNDIDVNLNLSRSNIEDDGKNGNDNNRSLMISSEELYEKDIPAYQKELDGIYEAFHDKVGQMSQSMESLLGSIEEAINKQNGESADALLKDANKQLLEIQEYGQKDQLKGVNVEALEGLKNKEINDKIAQIENQESEFRGSVAKWTESLESLEKSYQSKPVIQISKNDEIDSEKLVSPEYKELQDKLLSIVDGAKSNRDDMCGAVLKLEEAIDKIIAQSHEKTLTDEEKENFISEYQFVEERLKELNANREDLVGLTNEMQALEGTESEKESLAELIKQAGSLNNETEILMKNYKLKYETCLDEISALPAPITVPNVDDDLSMQQITESAKKILETYKLQQEQNDNINEMNRININKGNQYSGNEQVNKNIIINNRVNKRNSDFQQNKGKKVYNLTNNDNLNKKPKVIKRIQPRKTISNFENLGLGNSQVYDIQINPNLSNNLIDSNNTFMFKNKKVGILNPNNLDNRNFDQSQQFGLPGYGLKESGLSKTTILRPRKVLTEKEIEDEREIRRKMQERAKERAKQYY